MITQLAGRKVRKISGKPFKSTLKVNTISGLIVHPRLKNKMAYTFIEDQSYVEVDKCVLYEKD